MKIQINNNTLKRIIASGMMVVTMMSLAGCENKKEDISIVSSSQIITEENKEEAIISSSQAKENDSTEKNAKDQLIDKLNRETYITNSSEYMYENYKEIYKEELNDQQLDLASYAYGKLKELNINEKEYLKELNNVLIEQLNPRGLSDEKWQELFGTLISTLNEEESVYDTYFILARLLHETECQERHYVNDYDIYSCEVIQKEYNLKYPKIK